MKVFGKILKSLVALAAIAGAVYAVINYGDKILAWIKEKLHWDCCCGDNCCCCDDDCCCDCDCEEASAEQIAEEPTEETAEEASVQAEETDFEG